MLKPSQHARAINAPSLRESAWSDKFGRNATTIRQLQLLRQLLPTLLRTPPSIVIPGTNSTTPTIIATTSQYSSPVASTITSTNTPVTTTITTTSNGALSKTVLIATAKAPHVSAWSVTCESIAQRLVYQCLEQQPTAEIAASTALTVLAHSLTVWAYSVPGTSMTAEFTAMSSAPIFHTYPPLLPFSPPLP
ncbi:unnamed protein product [Schistocephalus solidus]|uniref:Uncharacterized protein n=1 Tax=Schistocephalus solidus TaxID=70667 RepID=A0A183SRX0_SCHSO|nr:unnamed protein product [Schistocephalus solidus]